MPIKVSSYSIKCSNKFLQNKDRIKEYLVSMFDIQSDINRTLAEYFQAFAYVFEAFASESGQQLTVNIIGIFADAFMGITELAEKIIRDIINIFTKPFIDNKEALRIALEGFLGVYRKVHFVQFSKDAKTILYEGDNYEKN